MKVKTLVAVVVSGMLAASFAYAAPSISNTQFVDDSTSSQPPTNDPAQNIGAMDNGAPANPGAADNMPSGSGDMNNTTSGSDEDTQDTASGDSDY